jgi:hypothetical protein
MRMSNLRTHGRAAFAVLAVVVALVAYSNIPVNAEDKAKSTHYARVRSDGVLVDGTAISASRFATGTYLVKFQPGIGACAATANSSSFLGFDLSVFRVSAQISVGFGDGGAFDDETVHVNFFSTTDGSNTDTSFSVILACP